MKKSSLNTLSVISLLVILSSLIIIYVCLSNLVYDSIAGQSDSYDKEEEATWQIVVDLDQLTLFVYKNETLEKKYPCSGGKNSTPSPTGDFKIISKDKWGEGFGGVWMGLSVPWGTYGIHGTYYSSIIGQENVSHGCIRLLTEDAIELADLVPLETPVRIVQENKPFITHYLGECGTEIYNAQIILQNLGYYNAELDGKFGKILKEAILEFQADYDLKETGSLNQKTYDKLLEVSN